MKITELIIEQEQIDELSAAGVGQGIGKAAGNVVQGTGNFFKGLKQGYKSARNPGSVPAQQTTPSANTSQIQAQIDQKKQEIKALQSQMTANEPGIGQANNTVAATATNTPAAQQNTQGVAPQPGTPPVEPGIGQQSNSVAATATNTPQPNPAQVRQQKQAAAAQTAQAQMAANPVKRNRSNPDDLGFGFDVDTGLPLKSQAEKNANIAKADAAEKAALAQVRQEKQTAAAKVAQDQMAANPAPSAPTPADIRQQKQTAAAQAAQDQMTPKPVGRTQGGGKVAGQLSQTPGAVRKRNARAAQKDWQSMATGTNESVEFYSKFLGKLI